MSFREKMNESVTLRTERSVDRKHEGIGEMLFEGDGQHRRSSEHSEISQSNREF